ncbi:calmodulin-A-like [Ylistrum balloti]|uniref:calmodulin-A-like n=1 Tax=Ylistrum balloti TaxID=509963 RepID=UPI002905E484|nr:calmodulin-A-like [Ylistrum balloti]
MSIVIGSRKENTLPPLGFELATLRSLAGHSNARQKEGEEEEEEETPLPKELLAEFAEAFDFFDMKKTGTITTQELFSVLRAMGQNATEAELNSMVNEVDADGNGTVEIDEFEEMMLNKIDAEVGPEVDKETFALFDADGDGLIGPEELLKVMRQFGKKVSEEEVKLMIMAVDKDGDGQVSFEEFCEMIAGDP